MKNLSDFIDQIINDKCENILPLIPDGSIDIIITSPPYNVDLGNNKFNKNTYDMHDDNLPYGDYLNWMEIIFKECYRVLKVGGRICVNIGDGQNGKIATHADFISKLKNVKFLPMANIIWNKNTTSNRCSWGTYCSPLNPSFPCTFEYIIIMAKETYEHQGNKEDIDVSPLEFKTSSLSIWKMSSEKNMLEKYDHPAVFPKELPKRLIKQLTYKNDVVLDIFSGSGTTCCVAKELGRRFVGIEMSKKYYDMSLERLSDVMKPELFV